MFGCQDSDISARLDDPPGVRQSPDISLDGVCSGRKERLCNPLLGHLWCQLHVALPVQSGQNFALDLVPCMLNWFVEIWAVWRYGDSFFLAKPMSGYSALSCKVTLSHTYKGSAAGSCSAARNLGVTSSFSSFMLRSNSSFVIALAIVLCSWVCRHGGKKGCTQ